MDLSQLNPAGRQVIQSYGDGGFRINGARHEGSVLVFPDATESWAIGAAGDLSIESLVQVVAATPKVEILVVGTGARMFAVPPVVR